MAWNVMPSAASVGLSTLLAILLVPASAERLLTHEQSLSADHEGAAVAFELNGRATDQARSGALFAGRFLLNNTLWRRSLEIGGQPRPQPVPVPDTMYEPYRVNGFLKEGGFGETWRAFDKKAKRSVAIKFFYSTDGKGKHYHVTWRHTQQSEELLKQIKAAAVECVVALKLQQHALSYPKGASRIMQCYEDHVSCPECESGRRTGTSTTGHKVSDSFPLYQVLEDCAGDAGTDLRTWQNEKQKDKDYYSRVVTIMKHVFEGLAYMTHPDASAMWVHHDLKPDNVVVKVKDGKEYAKIIDFGALTEATQKAASGNTIVTTFAYAPVEFFPQEMQFDYQSPWSYDVYSAGCMLHEMMTGLHTAIVFILGIKDSDKAAIKEECADEGKSCESTQMMLKAKKEIEPEIAKEWGLSDTGTKDMKATLFGHLHLDEFKDAVKEFNKDAERTAFFPVMGRILNPKSGERAKPAEVVNSEFMKLWTSNADPDFNAKEVQKRAVQAVENAARHSEKPKKKESGGYFSWFFSWFS